MSLVDTIARFKTGTYAVTYAVTRTVLGTYVNGRLVAGSTSSFNIDACIVPPTTGKELEIKAEGFSTLGTLIVYTATELFAESPTNAPDSIVINGDSHTVFRVVGPRTLRDQTFYEVWVARQRVP